MDEKYTYLQPFFGSWYLGELIGEGSFGKVYKIKRETFGKEQYSALKIIQIPQSQAELDQAYSEGMDDESATSYFKSLVDDITREIDLMSKLKGNSYVVSYEDHQIIKKKDGIGWTVLIRMELLTSLKDYIARNKPTQNDVIKLGIDICHALELCKKHSIIHRDIKAENIFVSDNGDYKLGDFGIARQLEKTMSGLSKKGTYTYMAPEVYLGKPYNASADIYSLGIVMYRLLNDNRAPFLPAYPLPITFSDREVAQNKQMAGEQMPPPKNADEKLAGIILKACAYIPSERFECPSRMRGALMTLDISETKANQQNEQGTNAFAPQTINPPAASDKTESIFAQTSGVVANAKAVTNVSGTTAEFTNNDKPARELKTQSKPDAEEGKTESILDEHTSDKTESLFDMKKDSTESEEKTESKFVPPAAGINKYQHFESASGNNKNVDTPNNTNYDYEPALGKHKKAWIKNAAVALFLLVFIVGAVAIVKNNQWYMADQGADKKTSTTNDNTVSSGEINYFGIEITDSTTNDYLQESDQESVTYTSLSTTIQSIQSTTKPIAQQTVPATQPANSTLSEIANAKTGDIVYFGKYEQDNNLSNGKETIAWRILAIENDKALLLSEKILDSKPYNVKNKDVTWETCTLRAWLKNDFYNAAFSSAEQAKISTSSVINKDNPHHGTPGGNTTSDKLFLLSTSDVKNPAYGFSSNLSEPDTALLAHETEYAKSQGLYTYEGNSYWWLRTPGSNQYTACNVYYDGSVNYYSGTHNVSTTGVGVRPALLLNLSS